jgi:hypothetical protein
MASADFEGQQLTLYVTREAIEAATSDDTFVHALRLARAANSMRFVIDHATRDADRNSAEAIRARFTGGVLLTAAVREALYVLNDKAFQQAMRTVPGMDELNALRSHPVVTAMQSGYLSRVRNKLAFHYVASDIRAAMKRRQPDLVIAVQWDLSPSSGAFYVVPEIDVVLSVFDHEVPSDEAVRALQEQFPQTPLLRVPDGEMTADTARYMRCLNAVYVLAFALCDATDRLVVPMFEAMVPSLGDVRPAGAEVAESSNPAHDGKAVAP